MNAIKKDISELKGKLSDISLDVYYCKWNHNNIRQEMEMIRSEFVVKEDNNTSPSHNEKTSQTHINHFFWNKKNNS